VPVGIDLDAGENGVWGAGRRSAQDASIAMFTLGMPVVDKAVQSPLKMFLRCRELPKSKLEDGWPVIQK
jgi:hypothetical protein